MHQELRYVRQPTDERPLFLPLDGEAPDPLVEPFGHVEIAVGADREAGRGLELAANDRARLELAAWSRFGNVVGEDVIFTVGPL